MKALRLNGRNSDCFTVGQKKRFFDCFRIRIDPKKIFADLPTPLPNSYRDAPWKSLQGKTIRNQNVILAEYSDVIPNPFQYNPRFECETLFLHNCDKKFLMFWLRKSIFINAKKVYINSHPGNFDTLVGGGENFLTMQNTDSRTRASKFDEIYLHEKFRECKDKWWSYMDSIKIITHQDFEKEMEKYQDEDLLLKE